MSVAASTTLERVEKLIALSASDREEEARTSAMLACKLIREHKLKVVGGFLPFPIPVIKMKPSADRRVMIAKFDGSCRCCQGAYRKGDRIAWSIAQGPIHLSCNGGAR